MRILRVLAILLLLLAATGMVFSKGEPGTAAGEKPTIRFLMGDQGRTQWSDDTYLIKEFAKQMGDVNIDLILVPRGDMRSKIPTLVAAGDLPDIFMYESGYELAMEYGPRLFFPVDTKFDMMPNLSKIRAEFPDYDKSMRHEDGHIYGMPWVAPYEFFTWSLMISPSAKKYVADPRKDIKTMDDLSRVLQGLKKDDPANYPMVSRAGDDLGRFHFIFGTNIDFYLNTLTGKYAFGPAEPNFKKYVAFMSQAYKAGIMHPDFFTLGEDPWRELFAAAKAHLTVDNYSQGISLGTDPNDPATWMITLLAPEVDGKRYFASYNRGSVNPDEGMYFINKDTKYADNLIKFSDWGYSEEGRNFMHYGKPGETCEVNAEGYYTWNYVPGSDRKEIWKPGETTNTLGLTQYPYVFRQIPLKEQFNRYIVEQGGGNLKQLDYNQDNYEYYANNNAVAPHDPLLSFTVDELDVIKQYRTPIETFGLENAIKFIKGEKPLSEWDAYVAQIKNMGLDRVLQAYESAYRRYNSK